MHFPFFGAGNATYFERVELTLRFVKSVADKKRVLAGMPPFLEARWRGKYVVVSSDQFVHQHIAGLKTKRAWFFAKPAQVKAFNLALEKWLLAVHDRCPLAVVYRAEDGEADGTAFSKWHQQSLTLAPALIDSLSGEAAAKEMLSGISQMAGLLRPVEPVLDAGDAKGLMALLERSRAATLEAMSEVELENRKHGPVTPLKTLRARHAALIGASAALLEGSPPAPANVFAGLFVAAFEKRARPLLKKIASDENASGIAGPIFERLSNPEASQATRDALVALAPLSAHAAYGVSIGLARLFDNQRPAEALRGYLQLFKKPNEHLTDPVAFDNARVSLSAAIKAGFRPAPRDVDFITRAKPLASRRPRAPR